MVSGNNRRTISPTWVGPISADQLKYETDQHNLSEDDSKGPSIVSTLASFTAFDTISVLGLCFSPVPRQNEFHILLKRSSATSRATPLRNDTHTITFPTREETVVCHTFVQP